MIAAWVSEQWGTEKEKIRKPHRPARFLKGDLVFFGGRVVVCAAEGIQTPPQK